MNMQGMKYSVLAFSLLALAACATPQVPAQQTATCRPAGYDRAQLDALKTSQWTIADDATRNRFAREPTSCLADPGHAIRDGIAFEALQH